MKVVQEMLHKSCTDYQLFIPLYHQNVGNVGFFDRPCFGRAYITLVGYIQRNEKSSEWKEERGKAYHFRDLI